MSPRISAYDGSRLGAGFVASHIWGAVTIANKHVLASRHYMLNSFVPNLVWLPVQISKLTDREGSLAQKLLQAISYKMYRGISMPHDISILWNDLPYPEELRDLGVDLTRMSYFVVPDEWLKRRIRGLVSEIDIILSLDRMADSKSHKIKSRRYLPTLEQIHPEHRRTLNEWLAKYKTLLFS